MLSETQTDQLRMRFIARIIEDAEVLFYPVSQTATGEKDFSALTELFEEFAIPASGKQGETKVEGLEQPALLHQAALIHKAVSDKLSDEDRLGYKNLARAIADLIKNPETSVPLAIAIRGPWGSGKSSLMKMVQKILDPGYTETESSESTTGSLQSFSSFLEALWGRPVWLGILSRFVKKVWYKLTLRPQKLVDTQEPNEPDRFTVWFNVWKYQTSEQVWAGLAHCIITQTTRRKNALERAKFWLKLHAKRVDANRLERDAWGLVFRSGIIAVGIALILSVAPHLSNFV